MTYDNDEDNNDDDDDDDTNENGCLPFTWRKQFINGLYKWKEKNARLEKIVH